MRRDIGDKEGIAISLGNLGVIAAEQGDFTAARALYNQSLTLQHEIGDRSGAASTLGNLGIIAAEQGDYAAAQANYSESQAQQRALGDKHGIAASSMYLGLLALAQRQLNRAQAFLGESLAQFHAIGDRRFVAHCLASLAALATDEAVEPATAPQTDRAARLIGATTSIMKSLDIQIDREVREPYQRAIDITQARLGDQAFATLVAEGQQMTMDEAVAFALAL
jgi:tetratricopeptide (TPR) repeat protein